MAFHKTGVVTPIGEVVVLPDASTPLLKSPPTDLDTIRRRLAEIEAEVATFLESSTHK